MEQAEYKTREVFAGNIIEAGMVQHLLYSKGIEADFRDEMLGMLAPWVASPGGAGAVKVMVAERDFTAAMALISTISFNEPESGEL